MFTAEYKGINSFLVGASALLIENGIKRNTRGHVCWELPAPFMFKITNPTARWITIPTRKWNLALPYAESLWLASGRNDLEMISHYLKNMKNFSDDGLYLRGGYGPRLRRYNGLSEDYKSKNYFGLDRTDGVINEIDQFEFIEKCFQRDVNTRQAIINISDPLKDCFDAHNRIKETKDCPCTRTLHFMKRPQDNKLNLTVYMRSNDILWGASAVNIFNFTFMQEYFAQILNLEVGDYYHIADSFHYYDAHRSKIEAIANTSSYTDVGYKYAKSFQNLIEFDNLINKLSIFEEDLRTDNKTKMIDLEDDFFNDWMKILYRFTTCKKMSFNNLLLNEYF